MKRSVAWLTDIENRFVVAKGSVAGGRMDWEFGISRCKWLYIEWINNKVLLYSTGNYIQYPAICHNGKNMKKKVYICVTKSLYCTAEINTPLWINSTSINFIHVTKLLSTFKSLTPVQIMYFKGFYFPTI